MVVSAAVLAFVVLYNLNNINITERRRELATFRLIGFYNSELAAYIFRENIILTVFGIVIGIIMGIVLHRFVMVTVETDVYMFGRELEPLSILIAVILTVIFTVVVNIITYFSLKKIDMKIDELKATEGTYLLNKKVEKGSEAVNEYVVNEEQEASKVMGF